MGLVITKIDPLAQGPLSRIGEDVVDLELKQATGYATLDEIRAALENTDVPDFVVAQAKITRLGITLPDDPMLIGMREMKRIIAQHKSDYRTLIGMRLEASGIQTEWATMQMAFNSLIATVEHEARIQPAYRECKNDDQRVAYLRTAVHSYRDVELKIFLALRRCNDFNEACRLKGKDLDNDGEAIRKQLDVLDKEIKLGAYTPQEI